MNKYKMIACLLNFEEEALKEPTKKDYDFIADEHNPFEERKERLAQYGINSNVVEEHKSEDKYIIDEDADGLYLLEKM